MGEVLKFNHQAFHLFGVVVRRSRLELVLLLTHGSDTALVAIRNAPITDSSCSLHCIRDSMVAHFIESQVRQRDCNYQCTIKRWD